SLRDIKTQKEIDAALKKLAAMGEKFVAYAQKDPKGANAYDALFQALRLSNGPKAPNGLWQKAMVALKKDHSKSAKIARLIDMLGGMEDEATLGLLRAVAENNPDAKTKAKARKLLSLAVGSTAPEVTSEDLGGKKVKLSDLRGKVVVLDIWAT